MKLHEYNKKRNFKSTPEPAGTIGKRKTKSPIFVVQKHDARNLHYDLRLEVDGVLKSWAVPKGPSLNPHEKHLAIETEDHPYDYKDFEGVIPEGEYGAGEVIIWDKGTYKARKNDKSDDTEKQMETEYKKGHLTFMLHGKKLKGEFALVKSPHMGEKMWLLIKKGDEFANESDVKKQDQSVTTQHTIEDLKGVFGKGDKKLEAKFVAGGPSQDMPKTIKPMLAKSVKEPFNDNEWLFEIKWDGYRIISYVEKQKVTLKSRNDKDYSDRFPEVTEALRDIKNDAVIDGEVVALDDKGRSVFEWVAHWGSKKQGKLVYYAFDLLWLNGHDISHFDLEKRRELLLKILPKSSTVKFSDHVPGKGVNLFEKAKRIALEGLVAKKTEGEYKQGILSSDWLKIKTENSDEFIIGGFTEPKGTKKYIGALLVGQKKKGGLKFAGKVSASLATKELKELREKLEKISLQKSPFVDHDAKSVNWVKPLYVAEIEFRELTSEGSIRHGVIKTIREDKDPSDVKGEEFVETHTPAVIETELHVTNRDKIFFPKNGYTKGDLIDYYDQVSTYILPHLKDRPQSLKRQPNGINGSEFFHKDMGEHLPKFINHIKIDSTQHGGKINYMIANDRDSLLYMVQLGAIEINPWFSRKGSLDKPDWIAIDLDPEAVGFDKVIETAQAVKQVLDELKIEGYPKTSGKRGIHIYIPLGAKYTYKQARTFAQLLANIVHERTPKLTSIIRSPKDRQGKVYLDYLQNARGQTLSAPYSVRPIETANVSMPLKWSEVKNGLKPEDFTIKNALPRIKKNGDLFKPVLGKGVNLKEIVDLVVKNK